MSNNDKSPRPRGPSKFEELCDLYYLEQVPEGLRDVLTRLVSKGWKKGAIMAKVECHGRKCAEFYLGCNLWIDRQIEAREKAIETN